MFRFRVNDQRWQVFKSKFSVTLDNTASKQEFHLLINDEPVVVVAGTSQTVESVMPIVASFDNGKGTTAVRQLGDGGTLTIRIDPQTRIWDLFADDAAASGAGSAADFASLSAPEPTEDRQG